MEWTHPLVCWWTGHFVPNLTVIWAVLAPKLAVRGLLAPKLAVIGA